MKYTPTPESIAEEAEHIECNRANRREINRVFRIYDESHLWPMCNRFNVTDRAIKRAQKFIRESGHDMAGLEYALFLESEISTIVNKEA